VALDIFEGPNVRPGSGDRHAEGPVTLVRVSAATTDEPLRYSDHDRPRPSTRWPWPGVAPNSGNSVAFLASSNIETRPDSFSRRDFPRRERRPLVK